MEDCHGFMLPADIAVERVDQIEDAALATIADLLQSNAINDGAGLCVEIQLPAAVHFLLAMAEQCVTDANQQVNAAAAALQHSFMCTDDIAAVLSDRRLRAALDLPVGEGTKPEHSASPYRALAAWNGNTWDVRIEDSDGRGIGRTSAERLARVEHNARQTVVQIKDRSGGATHRDGDLGGFVVVVKVQLPPEINSPLQDAEDLVRDANEWLDSFAAALREVHVTGHDIAAIVAACPLGAKPHPSFLPPDHQSEASTTWWMVTAES